MARASAQADLQTDCPGAKVNKSGREGSRKQLPAATLALGLVSATPGHLTCPGRLADGCTEIQPRDLSTRLCDLTVLLRNLLSLAYPLIWHYLSSRTATERAKWVESLSDRWSMPREDGHNAKSLSHVRRPCGVHNSNGYEYDLDTGLLRRCGYSFCQIDPSDTKESTLKPAEGDKPPLPARGAALSAAGVWRERNPPL